MTVEVVGDRLRIELSKDEASNALYDWGEDAVVIHCPDLIDFSHDYNRALGILAKGGA